MNHSLTLKSLLLGIAALCVAMGSDALTLGRARGGALLGQSLELSIPVQSAADEVISTECFEAEVFYGDVHQDAGRVSVRVPDAIAGQTFSVKVTSSAVVDEPVVTVYLRAGCSQKTTRKYVLLADMVSEPALTVVPVQLPVASPAVAVTDPKPLSAVPLASNAVPAPVAEKPPASKKARARNTTSETGTLRPPDQRRVAAVLQSVVKRPRLKLAAVDLIERDPVLRLSNELLTAPGDDLQKRAEAIAIWRSLNATAQDVLREQAAAQALGEDVKSLRDLTGKNQALISELSGRLEKAQSQRYANPLVYGLSLLLLALGTGLVMAWRRLRAANVGPYPWWSGNSEGSPADALNQRELDKARGAPTAHFDSPETDLQKTVAVATQSPMETPPSLVDIDIDLEMGPSVFASLPKHGVPVSLDTPMIPSVKPAAKKSEVRDYSPSVSATLRSINSKELLDVRQQADFFMTLGQYEDAISLLEDNIRASGDANPLVYLDLLKIFHMLSRKDDYDSSRQEFNQLFTGEVPQYVAFNQSGKRLEQYPEVCGQICLAWNSPHVLEVIESFLVRKQGAENLWEFDLEAYRDLLMLHGIASRLEVTSESLLVPFTAARETINGNDTTPHPVIGDQIHEVDFDLSGKGGNLIDFEVSGFSSVAPVAPQKN